MLPGQKITLNSELIKNIESEKQLISSKSLTERKKNKAKSGIRF
jgi:hypothetical protein